MPTVVKHEDVVNCFATCLIYTCENNNLSPQEVKIILQVIMHKKKMKIRKQRRIGDLLNMHVLKYFIYVFFCLYTCIIRKYR